VADLPGQPGDDDDHTVILPSPGGRRAGGPTQVQGRAVPLVAPPVGNPLVATSGAILALISRVRSTAAHRDVNALRQKVAGEIRAFEQAALARGVPRDTVFTARYALCAAVDEAVLGTPWGAEGGWSAESLLITFHKETAGGAKFFAILDRVSQDPAANLDLLELMYLCLRLGFKGKYMLMPDGDRKLDELQERLFERIRRYRGTPETELSPEWAPARVATPEAWKAFPLWAVAAIAGALLVVIYAGFSAILGDSADPALTRLDKVARSADVAHGPSD
jgi:type VI secretion system protein ImpK